MTPTPARRAVYQWRSHHLQAIGSPPGTVAVAASNIMKRAGAGAGRACSARRGGRRAAAIRGMLAFMDSRIIPLLDARAALPIPQAPADAPAGALRDRRGRRVHDLRISVTDRCNFRCVYCMPKTVYGRDYPFLPRSEVLSYEEITRLARLFAAHGVEKIRLTGGEPLLRHDLEELIAQLAAIPGVELTLTTNGSLLAKNAAAEAGLAPIKLNTVVKRGVNEHAVLDLARRFRGSGHITRFIEYMDVGGAAGWRMDEVVPSAEVIGRIDREFPLEPIDANYPGEVAERWRYKDGAGEIGVIASVTQAFCAGCTRARLSTEGKLYTCLFAQGGHDLRALLRAGRSDAEIDAAIAAIWRARDDHYSEIRTAETAAQKKIEMHYIGG